MKFAAVTRARLTWTAMAVPVLAPIIYAPFAGDPVTTATWVLTAATIALVVATLRLAYLMQWQTEQMVRAQENVEAGRRVFESDAEKRRTVDEDLRRALNGDWKPSLRDMYVRGQIAELGRLLQPHGITIDDLEAFFPEVFGKP